PPTRYGHRASRSNPEPPAEQGHRCNPGRHRGDVMASALTMPAPGPKPLDVRTNSMSAAHTPGAGQEAKARAAAQDFEAVFLNSMFQHMFTGLDGDGPFGGNR